VFGGGSGFLSRYFGVFIQDKRRYRSNPVPLRKSAFVVYVDFSDFSFT
jgi:hypothetical protein